MRFAAVAIAGVVLVAAGVYDAVRASRMADLQSSGVIQKKLDAIPLQFGDWSGEERVFDQKLLSVTQAIAHSYRRYVRTGTKPAVVDVLILAGDPGEIGAHDPERCYGGTGYRPLGTRSRKQTPDPGPQHSVWVQRFTRETLPAGSSQVAWGWTTDGLWRANDDARIDYADRELLYKIYLTRPLAVNESEAADPTTDLLSALAPLARTALSDP